MCAAVGAAAMVAACGSGEQPTSAIRATVDHYLTATTPAARCRFLSDVYRTMNPEVLLAGGCERSQRITAHEEAVRRILTITNVAVSGHQATVTLRDIPPDRPLGGSAGVPALTGLVLVAEHGSWRINGFTARAHGDARAGG
jgi:hypothetical protein